MSANLNQTEHIFHTLLNSAFSFRKDNLNLNDADLLLEADSVSFYLKHEYRWVKIRYYVYSKEYKSLIPYAFHGFTNEQGVIQSRDCHSEHHKLVSTLICDLLNMAKIKIESP